MLGSIDLEWSNNGAEPQFAFDNEAVAWLTVIDAADGLPEFLIFDIVNTANVKRGMGPWAVGQPANYVTDPGSAFHENHITRFQFMTDALEVTQRELPWRPFTIQELDY